MEIDPFLVSAGLSEKVEEFFARLERDEGLCDEDDVFLYAVEHEVEKKVLAEVRERQRAVPGLKVWAHGYLASWGDGDLTPGCAACLSGDNSAAIRSVASCNLSCPFCYYYGLEAPRLPRDVFQVGELLFTEDDLKVLVDKQGASLSGIAWVYFEPFLEFDKHPEVIRHVADAGIHQWMYTNGTLCEERHFRRLAEAGLTELRFNLAATGCSRQVLAKMKAASRYFEYLVVESPAYPAFVKRFLERRDEVISTGVTHVNLAELHLEENNVENFPGEVLYRYHRQYVSPVSSRQSAYDLIDVAAEERWPVVINDCSNETKFYRGVHGPGAEAFGSNSWFEGKLTWMPKEWYLDAISRWDLESSWDW
ncbi:MAG: radical SAM protein [Promethearchaeota archaeon]